MSLTLGLSMLQVAETTRDVCFLHNELFFAAAQKKYVYVYDKRGIEVHCLKEHLEPHALEFLPHHFLLCSIGESGQHAACSTGRPMPVVHTGAVQSCACHVQHCALLLTHSFSPSVPF